MENLSASVIPTDFEGFITFVRMAERVFLTIFFLVVASIIMIIYRKKIQNIDLNVTNEAGSIKTTTSLIMPVFVLLTVILFSYVVLQSPIYLYKSTDVDRVMLGNSNQARNVDRGFVGYGAGREAEQKLAQDILSIVTASFNLRQALSNVSIDQRNVLSPELDRLGRGASGLRKTLFEILEERFPDLKFCQPIAINSFRPSSDERCRDFNAFLFEQ